MAFALSQIFVTSINTIIWNDSMVPYQQTLLDDFGRLNQKRAEQPRRNVGTQPDLFGQFAILLRALHQCQYLLFGLLLPQRVVRTLSLQFCLCSRQRLR